MSGANPVETKTEAAAALSPPALGPAPKAGWLGWRKKLALAAGGSALVLAGGWYGLTHFKAAPPPAVAQSQDPAPEPPAGFALSGGPAKPAEPAPETLPEIKVPVVSDIKMPATKPADGGFADPPQPPVPDGDRKRPDKPDTAAPVIEPPPVPGDPTKDKADTAPPVVLPDPPPLPEPDKKTADPTKKPAEDPFKATGGLPETDKPKVEGLRTGPAPAATDVKAPVITTGGTGDPMPSKPDADKKADPMGPPPVPTLDVTPPDPPKPDGDKKSDLPPLVIPDKPEGGKPDATKPPAVTPPKPDADKPDGIKAPVTDRKDERPTLVMPKRPATGAGPATDKKDDPPTLPKIDVTAPDPVKPPATVDPSPMPTAVAPPADPKKKDLYDEDWHTPRPGETVETVNYVEISREYYKTADFAPALKAYNKDRRKADEKIIRVPPTWVLKEQFPNLVPKDDDRPAGADTLTSW